MARKKAAPWWQDVPHAALMSSGMEMAAQCGYLDNGPVIFMIQPNTMRMVGKDDEVEVGDVVEMAVRAAGGQPLSSPADSGLPPGRAPSWQASLKLPGDRLLISHPDWAIFYDGSMPTLARWRREVAATGDVVMITGPIAESACINPVVDNGLATWTRIPLAIDG